MDLLLQQAHAWGDFKTWLTLALGLSREGLIARANKNDEGNDESFFLAPLEEVVARGTTSAEELVRLYEEQWDRSMDRVFRNLTY